MTKFNLRFTDRRHTHIQSLTNTPTQFKKGTSKIVVRVAVSRLYPLSICYHKQLGLNI